MSEVNVTISAGFTKESAELYLTAFRTIIEASAKVIAEPERMLRAYPEYFMSIIDEMVSTNELSREEAINLAGEALAELFVINQKLAFMVGTEISEEIGAEPMSVKDMSDIVYRTQSDNKLETLSKEEVMEELSRIMGQKNGGKN